MKDSTFYQKSTVRVKGNLLLLDEPLVMGILNLTPDSFFDGGKYEESDVVLAQVTAMLSAGATIIDVGGYSSRPGADDVSEQEEIDRVIPAIKAILANHPEAIISIDTFRSNVARAAIDAGAAMVNDISGGNLDVEMYDTVAELQVPYILMHMQGTPKDMQDAPSYSDVVGDVYKFFSERINVLKLKGVADIILDPGFGFGKTLEHNYQLLNAIDKFKNLGCPVLAGASRKSMINKVIKTKPKDALNGTTVVNTLALQKGASILRVHDVKEAVEAVKIVSFACKQEHA